MAGTTYTYTPQMQWQPKKPVSGETVVPINWLIGGTNKFGTVSDVALLTKIPNKEIITDWYINFTTLSEASVM